MASIKARPDHADHTDNHERSGIINAYHQRPCSINRLNCLRVSNCFSTLCASANSGIWERFHGNTRFRWSGITLSQWLVECCEEAVINTLIIEGQRSTFGIVFLSHSTPNNSCAYVWYINETKQYTNSPSIYLRKGEYCPRMQTGLVAIFGILTAIFSCITTPFRWNG